MLVYDEASPLSKSEHVISSNMAYLPFCMLLIILNSVTPAKIPIAGFFKPENAEQELVFKLAVENVNHINQDQSFIEENLILEPLIEHVSSFDSYNISRRVCNLTQQGIGGIFGLQTPEAVGIMQSLGDSLDIPILKTFWDISSIPSTSAVNLYPNPRSLAKALVDVILDMDWTSYTIIYETDNGLINLQELLKSHKRSYTSEGHVPFTVWQLDPEADMRPLLKEISKTSESHIVLDCSTERVIEILKQAKEVKMLGDYHSYVLTSLDAHTLDYSELKLEATNITTLRLIDPQRHYVQSTVQDWVFFHKTILGDNLQITADTLKTEAALMYDAVKVYSEAVQKVQRDFQEEIQAMPLECSSEPEKWINGSVIINELKNLEIEGMTGTIKFNELGERSFFTIEITELTRNGFRKIGFWNPEKGISYTRTESQMKEELYQNISNKTFIVVSRLGRPYLSEVDSNLEGNARYEGYSMDLIDEIAKDLKFKYKFTVAPDGRYGSFNKETKQWDGLIKELREKRADLGICDLTITYERRSAVDFTMPFMNLGISILYSKPTKQPPDLFSFLSPFSIDVWMYMATAYLGISLLLYFLARCAPDEWDNPHPCNPDPTELECTFSLHNCLWFSIGSLMAQGCDLLPKALSTRVVAGMWWFFVLIMISSYTANLAAFLTMDRMEATIESVEDLANQNKIKYGVLRGGSSANFFRDSNVSLYQKIWSQMESSRPSVFTKSNDEGVERVLRGKRAYAFFMESVTIEYQKERHCELMQVGDLLDSKGYGIAMPFNLCRSRTVPQSRYSVLLLQRPEDDVIKSNTFTNSTLARASYVCLHQKMAMVRGRHVETQLQFASEYVRFVSVLRLLDPVSNNRVFEQDSPYRIAISGSVLRMQESGKLQYLKEKWWKGSDNKKKCEDEEKSEASSSELGIANVGGVFLVLAVGCIVAFFVSILEFLWNVRKVAVEEKISPGEAFLLEFKFAIQCYGTTKPVRKPREDSVVPEDDFAECIEEDDDEEEEDRGFFGDENMEEEYMRMNGFSNNIRAKSTQSYS